MGPDVVKTFADVLTQAGPPVRPIRSRWGHDAVPEWRRVPAIAVCEVGYVLLDLSVATVPEFVVSTPHVCQ